MSASLSPTQEEPFNGYFAAAYLCNRFLRAVSHVDLYDGRGDDHTDQQAGHKQIRIPACRTDAPAIMNLPRSSAVTVASNLLAADTMYAIGTWMTLLTQRG